MIFTFNSAIYPFKTDFISTNIGAKKPWKPKTHKFTVLLLVKWEQVFGFYSSIWEPFLSLVENISPKFKDALACINKNPKFNFFNEQWSKEQINKKSAKKLWVELKADFLSLLTITWPP